MDDRRRRSDQMEISLFWRVCLVNAVVFAAGLAVLAMSPATVSAPVLPSELLVLLGGLALLVLANAALVRATLAPL